MAESQREICLQGARGGKLWITSLNSQFSHRDIQHKIWYVFLNESESRLGNINFDVGRNYNISRISK